MEIKTKDNELNILLDNRIDSNSVNGVEEQIKQAIEKQQPENIVLDARELQYISSAGLRLLLKLQKCFSGMKVQNVSKEVNDIFEMTGFDQILHIEKALREISIEGKELIGEGGYGLVYRLDDETIVKVYKVSDLEAINKQMDSAKQAFFHGVPTAISYDTVKVGDHYGSVFELIRSDTLAALLDRHPELLDEYTEKLFDILKIMSKTDVSDFIETRTNDHYKSIFEDIQDRLSPEEWKQLIDLIDTIPLRPTMIHSDVHAKNVMVQDGELLLIDMDEMMQGHPIYDIADIYFCYTSASKRPNGRSYVGMETTLCQALLDKILTLYLQDLNEADREAVLEAIKVVSSLRYYECAILNLRKYKGQPQYEEMLPRYLQGLKEQVLPYQDVVEKGLARYPEF